MQQLSLNIEDYKFVITGIFLFLHGFIYFNLARGLFGSFDSSIGPSLTLKSILIIFVNFLQHDYESIITNF